MKKLIALSGIGDCGKTSTLNAVIEKLRISGGEVEILHKTEPTSKPKPDITAIIKINGKKVVVITVGDKKELIVDEIRRIVGVTTAGDKKEQIESGFELLAHFDCDVIICASRSRGAGYKFVEEFASKNSMEFSRIKKERGKNDDDRKADEIIKIANL